MKSAEWYAARHYEYFKETVECVNLAELYEIPAANIVLSQKSACHFELLWEYKSSKKAFSAMFEFKMPTNYPFHPPIWSFASSLPEMEVFQNVVFEQNCQNEDGWSPALKFEKDILNLSVRVLALI